MRIYALFDLSPELFTCCSLASCPTTQITHRFTLIQLYQNDYIIFVIFNLFDISSTLKENENNNFLFILKYMYGASMLPIHVLQFTFPRTTTSTMCRQSDQVLRWLAFSSDGMMRVSAANKMWAWKNLKYENIPVSELERSLVADFDIGVNSKFNCVLTTSTTASHESVSMSTLKRDLIGIPRDKA